MNNFITVSNISNLHYQIKNSVNLRNIFQNDEDSVKYLINIMNKIYNNTSFIDNIHVLNDNTLNTYINSLLPTEYIESNNSDQYNLPEIETSNEPSNEPSNKTSNETSNEPSNEPKIIIKNKKIIIDSKNNSKKNNYIYNLPNNINNISSIELESAKIPKTQYIINKNNNKILFQENYNQEKNNNFHVSILDIGNYTIDELKQEIEDSLNILGESKYTIDINKKTNKISIASDMNGGDKIFNLKFEQNLFGFKPNVIYKNNNKYQSENMFNLDENNMLYLYLKNINNHEPFGTLFLDCNQNKTYFFTKNKYSVKLDFEKKIDNLDKLEIFFKDENNNEYDFNNFDHTLLLNIEYLDNN